MSGQQDSPSGPNVPGLQTHPISFATLDDDESTSAFLDLPRPQKDFSEPGGLLGREKKKRERKARRRRPTQYLVSPPYGKEISLSKPPEIAASDVTATASEMTPTVTTSHISHISSAVAKPQKNGFTLRLIYLRALPLFQGLCMTNSIPFYFANSPFQAKFEQYALLAYRTARDQVVAAVDNGTVLREPDIDLAELRTLEGDQSVVKELCDSLRGMRANHRKNTRNTLKVACGLPSKSRKVGGNAGNAGADEEEYDDATIERLRADIVDSICGPPLPMDILPPSLLDTANAKKPKKKKRVDWSQPTIPSVPMDGLMCHEAVRSIIKQVFYGRTGVATRLSEEDSDGTKIGRLFPHLFGFTSKRDPARALPLSIIAYGHWLVRDGLQRWRSGGQDTKSPRSVEDDYLIFLSILQQLKEEEQNARKASPASKSRVFNFRHHLFTSVYKTELQKEKQDVQLLFDDHKKRLMALGYLYPTVSFETSEAGYSAPASQTADSAPASQTAAASGSGSRFGFGHASTSTTVGYPNRHPHPAQVGGYVNSSSVASFASHSQITASGGSHFGSTSTTTGYPPSGYIASQADASGSRSGQASSTSYAATSQIAAAGSQVGQTSMGYSNPLPSSSHAYNASSSDYQAASFGATYPSSLPLQATHAHPHPYVVGNPYSNPYGDGVYTYGTTTTSMSPHLQPHSSLHAPEQGVSEPDMSVHFRNWSYNDYFSANEDLHNAWGNADLPNQALGIPLDHMMDLLNPEAEGIEAEGIYEGWEVENIFGFGQ